MKQQTPPVYISKYKTVKNWFFSKFNSKKDNSIYTKKNSNIVNIVIPIYKALPDESELISFKQAIKILSHYKFTIISPTGLCLDYYKQLFEASDIDYDISYFPAFYFQSVAEYNKLMLNKIFYQSFSGIKYILIYQLDAYVFKDELEYWCNLDFDYIGAPWIENFEYTPDTILKFNQVGNGGFSLRRTQTFIDHLNDHFPIFSYKQLWEKCNSNSFFQKIAKLPLIFIKSLGYKNTMNYYVKTYLWNEDFLWCISLKNSRIQLKIPDVKTASKFSMEMGAKQLYEENGFNLPFGCHAWEKYDYDFWKTFIPIIQ